MRRVCSSLMLVGLAFAVTPSDALAQSGAGRGALIGGTSGAVIGGIAGRGRGALIGGAIGAGTGAIIGDQMQRSRRSNFYWYNNRCWQRSRSNEFFPVASRYCR